MVPSRVRVVHGHVLNTACGSSQFPLPLAFLPAAALKQLDEDVDEELHKEEGEDAAHDAPDHSGDQGIGGHTGAAVSCW